jgi:hypothetical protein
MATVTKPKYPLVSVGSVGADTDIPGNDSKHNFPDMNGGGGPRGTSTRIPPKSRGSFGTHGQKNYSGGTMGGGRSGTGNPAGRGGFRGEAQGGSFHPESRIPGHGGSPQRGDTMEPSRGGGMGKPAHGPGMVNRHAPARVSQYNQAHPRIGTGNTAGTASRRVQGHFNRKSMGAKGNTGMKGAYGGTPVTANT